MPGLVPGIHGVPLQRTSLLSSRVFPQPGKAGYRAHHARPDGSDAAVPVDWLKVLQAAKPAVQAVYQALAPE
jgi:hypothetical protein